MNATRPDRRQRRKADRPGEILAAALECFGERGYTATRLEDVAARAGVTKGTIYLYFPNKAELFKALVRTELVPILEKIEGVAAAPGTAATVLEQLFATWVERVLPSPVSVIPKLVLTEAGNFPELAKFYLDEVAARGLGLLASILRRGIAAGEFRPVNVDHAVYCVLAPLLFAALWQHSLGRHAERPLDARQLCRTHLDLLTRGLEPRPSPETRRRR